MKKLLLIAFIAITSVANAKNCVEKKSLERNREVKKIRKYKKSEAKKQRCTQYGMIAWCKPNEMVIDTVCYEDTSEADYQRSRACIRENGELYNEFICGTNTYGG